jgi:arylsulfatase A-like enzyme
VLTADHGEALGEKHALPSTTKHFGNPSFDPLLKIPLIVAPPVAADPARMLRSQDLRNLLREIIGLAPLEPQDLAPDEVFLTERFFRTYRDGRFKSMWQRGQDEIVLFDLEADPGETKNVAADRPDIARAHRARIEALTQALATETGKDSTMSADDEERLRALGYIE